LLLGLFSLWQFSLYQRFSKKPLACGGDWAYNIRCPIGTYCQSLGKSPLAAGFCKPFFSPLFDIFNQNNN